MKKLSMLKTGILAGLAVAAGALPASANAQRWENINARQARLDQRIDQGIRSGALTRNEAVRLRTEFRSLNNLEYRYRRTGGGLSQWERNDLNRHFDVLSAKVRWEKHDRADRRY